MWAWSWQKLDREVLRTAIPFRTTNPGGEDSPDTVGCKLYDITRPRLNYFRDKEIAAAIKSQPSSVIEVRGKRGSFSIWSEFQNCDAR